MYTIWNIINLYGMSLSTLAFCEMIFWQERSEPSGIYGWDSNATGGKSSCKNKCMACIYVFDCAKSCYCFFQIDIYWYLLLHLFSTNRVKRRVHSLWAWHAVFSSGNKGGLVAIRTWDDFTWFFILGKHFWSKYIFLSCSAKDAIYVPTFHM